MLLKKHDVFSQSLISGIRDFANTQDMIRTNHRSWTAGVVGMSGPIYLVDLPECWTSNITARVEEVFTEFNFSGLKATATYTLGGRFSFIPWHTDGNHALSVTVYLNEFWDRNWGGYFIYEQDENVVAVIPQFNTAVGFECPLEHCTVMPSIDAPLRESVQLFFDKIS